jgi:hypothetical protein
MRLSGKAGELWSHYSVTAFQGERETRRGGGQPIDSEVYGP